MGRSHASQGRRLGNRTSRAINPYVIGIRVFGYRGHGQRRLYRRMGPTSPDRYRYSCRRRQPRPAGTRATRLVQYI